MRAGAAGLGFAVVSAATFGTAGTFGSALIKVGWTPGAAVTSRVSIAGLVLLAPAVIALRGRWRALWHAGPTVLAYGLLAVGGAQLFFFQALQHLSVGVALLLEYSGTLLVVAWLWLRHGQRPRRLTVCGALLAIGGMVLVLDLTGSQRVDFVGVLWGLGAAVGLAAYFMISARTEDSVPPIVTAAGGLLVAAVVLALACLTGVLRWRSVATDTRLAGHEVSWVVPLLGVSLVAAAIAYTTGIAAARRLGARLASFVGLGEVLAAVLIAWVALGQRPALLQGIGGVVVLAGIALVRADEHDPDAPAADGVDPSGTLEIPLAGASPQ